MKMNKSETTNNKIIYIGLAIIVVVVLAFIIFSKKDEEQFSKRIDFRAIDDAVAGTFIAPSELSNSQDYDLLLGKDKAQLKLVVYEDYSSPYSADLAKTLEVLQAEYKDELALVVRPFLAKESASAQIMTSYLCAHQLGKAKEARADLLSRLEQGLIAFDQADFISTLKLKEKDFNACLTAEASQEVVENIRQTAKANNIIGVPTILVGTEMISGARPYGDYVDSNGDAIEGLKTVVERNLASN